MPRQEIDPIATRDSATIVFSAEQVAGALDRMAVAIDRRLAGTRPILLTIMKGGVFTATELGKRLRVPYEFDYVHATRYADTTSGHTLEWRVPVPASVRGRVVLLVDDVLDHGTTLEALISRVREAGAAELYTAVLVRKRAAGNEPRPAVDFVGLDAGEEYLFGCGMDVCGYWRGLPAIYGIGA